MERIDREHANSAIRRYARDLAHRNLINNNARWIVNQNNNDAHPAIYPINVRPRLRNGALGNNGGVAPGM